MPQNVYTIKAITICTAHNENKEHFKQLQSTQQQPLSTNRRHQKINSHSLSIDLDHNDANKASIQHSYHYIKLLVYPQPRHYMSNRLL